MVKSNIENFAGKENKDEKFDIKKESGIRRANKLIENMPDQFAVNYRNLLKEFSEGKKTEEQIVEITCYNINLHLGKEEVDRLDNKE